MKPENNIFQRIQEGQEIKQTDPEIQNLYKTFDETLKQYKNKHYNTK